MKGLSSTALQKTTSLAQPMGSMSAVSRMIRPMSATASMLMPARVEPTLTLAHTSFVAVSARGIERISLRSLSLKPFWARAEKPPMKLMPTASAARSRTMARGA